ncbi:hypothetical protein [Kineosporia sp. R_H_3]|uniref:hypothetical protein n=1 Tax=Kineosporia sp. R_H_3 TaxID=1961848 RepID=UPI000B4B1854|nr:hypothetical protein [Kineosporia sp. R_H_3]
MAQAWCDGGPADGDVVDVELDRTNLPPRHIRRVVMALDEATETVWWVGVRYARAPFWRLPRPGEPWRYFHCPPTRATSAG